MKASVSHTPYAKLPAIFILAGLLSSCDNNNDEIQSTDKLGMANPSAVFCVEQGGEYLLSTGQCKFSNGDLMDAWEYYRANH